MERIEQQALFSEQAGCPDSVARRSGRGRPDECESIGIGHQRQRHVYGTTKLRGALDRRGSPVCWLPSLVVYRPTVERAAKRPAEAEEPGAIGCALLGFNNDEVRTQSRAALRDDVREPRRDRRGFTYTPTEAKQIVQHP